jgi:GNAT superfamily N-acetyltransferase
MTLRDATPADADAIAAVHHASRSAALRGIIPDDLLDIMSIGERRARWEAWLSGTPWVTVLAEVRGLVVGFASVGPSRDPDVDPESVAEMPTLYVHPTHWRRGIGRGLCTAVVSRVVDLGFRQLTLWTLDANRNAKLFYTSLGFAPDGATKTDDDPVPTDLLALRLRMALD